MFHCFVVFAEMRTGSNFLESNLNAMSGVTCHGEAFNPHFIGYPNLSSLLGVTEDAREADPMVLLQAIRSAPGLNGFRYFHDHDPRIFDALLDDPRCAKVILTRNPVDSYVSWKIARSTGQWKLTDAKRRKAARAHFDAVEFAEHLAATGGFQRKLARRLQALGQTAFHLRYDDLGDLEIMNGVAAFLGADAGLDAIDTSLKVQNPAPLSEKVVNFDEMQTELAGADVFGLDSAPDFEPSRVAAVPSYVAAAKTPLLYLPVRGGPEAPVRAWMAQLDGVAETQLLTKMSQKTLRQWKRANKRHRSFTVLRHPLARAYHAYCAHILGWGKPVYGAIRQTLVRRYDLPAPEEAQGDAYDAAAHRDGFEIFLRFLKQNLAGQTSIRVDPAWCSQVQALQGFGRFALPDFVLREEELPTALPEIATRVSGKKTAYAPQDSDGFPISLEAIYDDTLEALASSAYARDYLMFGFEPWKSS